MGILTFIEKQTICRLFGISDGYIFKFWSDRGSYNKNITQQLILESCGIDIYKDKPYKDLSQQKCVEKIWSDSNPQTVANFFLLCPTTSALQWVQTIGVMKTDMTIDKSKK